MSVMKLNQIVGMLALTTALCSASLVMAQSAPASPAGKTIGATSSPKSEIVPSLIVLNSRGATLQGEVLTLTGVTPNSIVFADRPVRAAGHAMTADIIAEWGAASPGAQTADNASFAKDPPNATVSVFNKDGSVKDVVLVLKGPKLEGEKLTFNVQVLEGDIIFHMDGVEHGVGTGGLAVAPRGVPHAFMVVSPVVRMLCLHTPGCCQAFYWDASEPISSGDGPGPVDFGRVQSSATKNGGIEILGPPPFTRPASG